MSFFIIPTSNDPFYTQTVNLEGVDYRLEFRYNQREACWYLSFFDINENEIVTGIKLVSNWPLLRRFHNPSLPPGELVALVNGGDDSPATINELGQGLRVELVYATKDELP